MISKQSKMPNLLFTPEEEKKLKIVPNLYENKGLHLRFLKSNNDLAIE